MQEDSRSDGECKCVRDGGDNGLEDCTEFDDIAEGETANGERSGNESEGRTGAVAEKSMKILGMIHTILSIYITVMII